MAKTKISEWSTTPASNTDIDGINIAEGCAPSGINDAIRDLMAQVRSWQSGASGDPFNGPMNGTIGATTAYSGAFTTLSASGTTTLSGLTASTALALDASKNVVSVTNTGSGSNVLATSPTLVTPALGTPSSATLTNATGLPISTGVSGLGTGVATALAVNVGSAGAPVVNGGALGTPSSGTVTNLTGTASININGTVGATTPTTGAFTTIAASSSVTLSGGTANGVTYLNGSKVLTSGSALTFDGTTLENTGKLLLRTSSAPTVAGQYGYDASVGTYIWSKLGSGSNFTLYNNAGYNAYTIDASDNHIWARGTGSEQMRLTSTGLGIGTSSPAVKLDFGVTTNGTQIINLRKNSNSVAGLGVNAQFGVRIAGPSDSDAPVSFGEIDVADGTTFGEFMRLDSAGNLGLGVTPNAGTSGRVLQTSNAGHFMASGPAVYIDANAYFDSGWKYITTAAASNYYQSSGAHIWNSAASGTAGNAITFTQAMTLNASGFLGIGQTSPISYLDIYGNGAYTYARFYRSDEAGYGGRVGTGNTLLGAAVARSLGLDGYAGISFGIAGSQVATIDSSGNVGIGATAPKNPDGYNSNFRFLTLQATTGGNDRGALLELVGTGGGAPNYWLGRIGFFSTGNAWPHASITSYTDSAGVNSGTLLFATTTSANSGAATEKMRIDSSGNLLIGTTSAVSGGGVLQVSNGITFPATQSASSNANTLDDYEEGSFTPTAFGATTTGTTTYSTQSGSYTKIGRQVTVVVATYWTAMTGTGNLRIGNLPFTSSVISAGSILIDDLNWDGGSQITPLLVNGESEIRIYYCGDNIATAQQQCVNESAGMRITLTYFV